jgi:hypothetical protein
LVCSFKIEYEKKSKKFGAGVMKRGYMLKNELPELKEYEFIDLKEGYEIKGHIIKIRKSIIERYKQELYS